MSRSIMPILPLGNTMSGLGADGTTEINSMLEGMTCEFPCENAPSTSMTVGGRAGHKNIMQLLRNDSGATLTCASKGVRMASGYFGRRVAGLINTTGGYGLIADEQLSAAVGIDYLFWACKSGIIKATYGGTVTVHDELAFDSSGQLITLDLTTGSTDGVQFELQCPDGKLGATSGGAVRGANNIWHSTVPASQSGSTLVFPVHGLRVGDYITGFGIRCQIESAGNTCTVDGELRSTTTAAGDLTDASVASMTQISKTADAAIGASNDKTGLSDVVATAENFYILVTVTTAASTDVDIQHCVVFVKRDEPNKGRRSRMFALESGTSSQLKKVQVWEY